MIYGIPNRPLYFYQKDIVAMQIGAENQSQDCDMDQGGHLDHCWKRNEGAFCWLGSAVMQAFCFRTCFKAHGEAVELKLYKNLGLVNPKFGLKKRCHQPPAHTSQVILSMVPGMHRHGSQPFKKGGFCWPLSRIVQLWMRPMFQGSLKIVKSGEKNIEKLI